MFFIDRKSPRNSTNFWSQDKERHAIRKFPFSWCWWSSICKLSL